MSNIRSTLALSLCALAVIFTTFSRSHHRAISWDVFGYYLYLPSLFYHNDVSLKDITPAEQARARYDLSGTLYQVHSVDGRGHVIQYTSGMAIAYLPAFVCGHLLAGITGAEQDGYSEPYQLCISIWSCVIAFAGLYVLRKLLLGFFSDSITAAVLLMIVFATNYLITIGRSPALSHNYLFFYYALLLWNTIRWHQSHKAINMAGMAIALGMASLTRPTELVAVFIPLFWNTTGIKSMWQKVKSILQTHRSQVFLFAAIMFVCALPQLIYWKVATGHFVFNSYTNPGEGFDFLTPHTADFLFSFRKGWFVYTPVMFIALSGLLVLRKKRPGSFIALVVFIIVNLYIISSWSCWWYAHCYSQRAMIQSYPVMAILLGFVLLFLSENKKWRIPGTIILGVASLFTVFQSWQYDNNILDGSRMTAAYYFKTLFKTSPDDEDKKLLLINRSLDGSMDFENRDEYVSDVLYRYSDLAEIKASELLPVDSFMLHGEWLSEEKAFSKEYKIKWKDLTTFDHCWLSIRAEIFCPEDFQPQDLCIVTTVERKGDNYGYSAISIQEDSLKRNAWNTIQYDYLTPEVRSGNDKIKIYAWYKGKSKVFLKEITATRYQPKIRK